LPGKLRFALLGGEIRYAATIPLFLACKPEFAGILPIEEIRNNIILEIKNNLHESLRELKEPSLLCETDS